MRKREALSGARKELLLDLSQNRASSSKEALSQYRGPLAERWNATAWVPRDLQSLKSSQAKFSNLPLFSIPQMSCFQFRQPILCQTILGLLPSFASMTGGWVTLVWYLSPGRGPEAENSTLAGELVDPAHPSPALGGSSEELVSWGVRLWAGLSLVLSH